MPTKINVKNQIIFFCVLEKLGPNPCLTPPNSAPNPRTKKEIDHIK